ncbi:hypothetical protein CSUI_009333, partial [Cystoisospora suis]
EQERAGNLSCNAAVAALPGTLASWLNQGDRPPYTPDAAVLRSSPGIPSPPVRRKAFLRLAFSHEGTVSTAGLVNLCSSSSSDLSSQE